jgi:hypothetical protein
MSNEPDVKVINWGTDPIRLEFPDEIGFEFKLVQVHLKEDGAENGEPTFCMVLHHPTADRYVYYYTSAQSCNAILNQIGYQINKLDDYDRVEFENVTGFKSKEEYTAYELGRTHEQKVTFDFVEKWKEGETNSVFGQLLQDKLSKNEKEN